MKVFRIDIDVTSTTWDTCCCYIEAETEDEARAIFNEDPWAFDWDEWETVDSETKDWTVDKVEYDEWMTNRWNNTDPPLTPQQEEYENQNHPNHDDREA